MNGKVAAVIDTDEMLSLVVMLICTIKSARVANIFATLVVRKV